MSSIARIISTVQDPSERRKRNLVTGLWIVGIVLAFLLPEFIHGQSHLNLAILILMAAQIGVAWNIVGGYAGQVSLGHVAFYGLGSYTTAFLFLNHGINPWFGMVLGSLVAAVLSLPIGWSCFRLKGHYFAMATIAVAEIIQIVFSNWDQVGSSVGLTLPMDKLGLETLIFAEKAPYYYFALVLLLISLAVNLAIERSFIGYYFRAIKDEPDAARSLGVSLSLYKQIAFAISAALASLGGSLYALKELYIDPASVLSIGVSIKMALVSILGGVGTLLGPLVGAAVLTSIEEITRALFGGSGRGTDQIVYAALIILIAVYYPTGIVGWLRSHFSRRKAVRANTETREPT